MAELEKIYLTPEGVEKFKADLEHLEEEVFPEVKEELREAQEEEPDPGENPAYRDALQEHTKVGERIEELKSILNNYELIEGGSGDKVELGSKVTVEIEGEKDKFQIVGPLEADPAEGKISDESPVGKALLGSRPGSVVDIEGSPIKATYKVLSIA